MASPLASHLPDCSGCINSLVELLQGKLAKGVMERVCRQGDGLFPAPGEIKLSCSCPDWAGMCKHVAAVLYGVGARSTPARAAVRPARRGRKRLVAGASGGLPVSKAPTSKRKVLADDDVAALFGLDMAEAASAETTPSPAAAKQSRKLADKRNKAQGGGRTATVQAEAPGGGPKNRYLPGIACPGQEAPIRDGEAEFAKILEAGAWIDVPTKGGPQTRILGPALEWSTWPGLSVGWLIRIRGKAAR